MNSDQLRRYELSRDILLAFLNNPGRGGMNVGHPIHAGYAQMAVQQADALIHTLIASDPEESEHPIDLDELPEQVAFTSRAGVAMLRTTAELNGWTNAGLAILLKRHRAHSFESVATTAFVELMRNLKSTECRQTIEANLAIAEPHPVEVDG